MATWKVAGMVLLVVLPGGSLVLLGLAAYQAYQRGQGPLAALRRSLRRQPAPGPAPTLAVVPSPAQG